MLRHATAATVPAERVPGLGAHQARPRMPLAVGAAGAAGPFQGLVGKYEGDVDHDRIRSQMRGQRSRKRSAEAMGDWARTDRIRRRRGAKWGGKPGATKAPRGRPTQRWGNRPTSAP